MEVKIEITEGCTSYSYTINDIEYKDLIDKESEYYNPNFVYNVLEAMVKELYEQKKNNNDLLIMLNDVLSFIKLENSQWFFERLFHFNKNTRVTDSYHCDQCGDTVITETLIINTI